MSTKKNKRFYLEQKLKEKDKVNENNKTYSFKRLQKRYSL